MTLMTLMTLAKNKRVRACGMNNFENSVTSTTSVTLQGKALAPPQRPRSRGRNDAASGYPLRAWSSVTCGASAVGHVHYRERR
jgi:hypothetical protein